MSIPKTFIKNLQPGQVFSIVPNTAYEAVAVHTEGGQTRVTYTVEGSHFRGETTFVRPAMTTVWLIDSHF